MDRQNRLTISGDTPAGVEISLEKTKRIDYEGITKLLPVGFVMTAKRSSSASLFGRLGSLPMMAAALIGTMTFASQPAAALDLRDLVGDWAIPDTHETLTIRRNGIWYHPKFGRAKVRVGTDASDITVHYEGIETKCSYRVTVADAGNTLIFARADSRQDNDRCPAGAFKSVDR